MFHLLMRLVTPNSSEPLSTITQPEVRRTPCSQKEDTPTNISHARLYFVRTSLAIASEHSQQNPSLLQSEHLCSYSSKHLAKRMLHDTRLLFMAHGVQSHQAFVFQHQHTGSCAAYRLRVGLDHTLYSPCLQYGVISPLVVALT